MNSTNLSHRLQVVSDHVNPGSRLADIGSDHGYLPIHLAKKGIIKYGVVGEVAKGPLANASSEIEREHLQLILHPRLADGLDAIQPEDKIDVITIAGMGGTLISDILERGKMKLSQSVKLVLQPNVGESVARRWLMNNSYQIVAEQIIEENGHIYEVITAEQGANLANYSAEEIEFGPFLLKERSTIFLKKWRGELNQRQRVLNSLRQAKIDESKKINEFENQIKLINEVLNGEG